MSDQIQDLANELNQLPEIKTPGTRTNKISEENLSDFDADGLAALPPMDDEPTESGASAPKSGEYAEHVKFDASSYVEQGVMVADALLQMLFNTLDKNVTLAKEDRNALDFLIWKAKNNQHAGVPDAYEQWLLSVAENLSEAKEGRVMTDAEKENIVNALKQMPWLKDKLMTPANQLTLALLLYFGVRLAPIGFKKMSGPEQPPADVQETETIVTPPPITKQQTQNPQPEIRNPEPALLPDL